MGRHASALTNAAERSAGQASRWAVCVIPPAQQAARILRPQERGDSGSNLAWQSTWQGHWATKREKRRERERERPPHLVSAARWPTSSSHSILSTRRLGGSKGVWGPGAASRCGVGCSSRLCCCLAGSQVRAGPRGLGHRLVRQALLGALHTGCVGVEVDWGRSQGRRAPHSRQALGSARRSEPWLSSTGRARWDAQTASPGAIWRMSESLTGWTRRGRFQWLYLTLRDAAMP